MPPASASASASSKNNGRISDWEAGVSLAKAIMGAGSFALPWAFSKMGYVAGPIFVAVFLGLSVHSIGLLVDCACWLRKQRRQRGSNHHGSQPLTYVEVARSAFGPVGATLSYLTGMSASIGVCGSYLVFVAVNLESLLWSSSSSPSPSSSASIVSSGEESSSPHTEQGRILFLIWTVVLPLAVLLSSVRDPKRFAAVSFWGDVSVVAGMLAVLVYGIADAVAATATAATATATNGGDSSNGGNKIGDNGCVAVGSLENMALAFGSIGYLFLVHFLVLPIESNMVAIDSGSSRSSENRRFEERDRFRDHEPQYHPALQTARPGNDTPANDLGDHRNRFQRVVLRTFAICGGIGGFFGIAGYLLFGADTREIVLLNVRGGIGMTIVRFLLCVDLVLTYPVVMRPSIGILEQQWSVFARRRQLPSGGDSPIPSSARMVTIPLDNNDPHASPPSSCNKRNTTPGSLEIDGSGGETAIDIGIGIGIGIDIATHDTNDGAVPVLVDRKTHAAVCVALGCIAAGAATFVPAFGLLSGLVGGVSQTFLAFVLPPLMWAKQRERLLGGGRGKHESSAEDDCFHTSHQNRNKNPSDTTSWSFLRVLPWRERGLVLCGFGLVVWTLRSTWAELGGGGD